MGGADWIEWGNETSAMSAVIPDDGAMAGGRQRKGFKAYGPRECKSKALGERGNDGELG